MVRKAIYDQDCQSYRYQDQKKWDRFKTASLVEGAVFYALYGTQPTGVYEKRLAIIAGFLMLLIISAIGWKDQFDADRHMKRISEFERDFKFDERGSFRWGKFLMGAAIFLLLLIHMIVGALAWSRGLSPPSWKMYQARRGQVLAVASFRSPTIK